MAEKFKGNMNWDLPYHDFLYVHNTSETDTLTGMYKVGQNNIDAHGDQKKHFISKHMRTITIGDNTVYD